MDDGGEHRLEIAHGLAGLPAAEWDALANPPGAPYDPFLSWAFLEALEASGCVAPETGWAPRHLLLRDGRGRLAGAMPMYAKGHSYGEYVFDHAWADALHRAGGRYYPKLLGAAPFTPVTGRRLLAASPGARSALLAGAVTSARAMRMSSVHINFLPPEDLAAAEQQGYAQRAGVQFHWNNPGYRDFEDFLATLSANRRKSIRRERLKAREGLEISLKRGAEITEADWDCFFACYLDTGARKWGSPYLNRVFFSLLGERLKERAILFLASAGGRPVACALNLLGDDCLYGRYWGRLEERPFLHFELCYYQAIDFAIQAGLPRVEAGAQGEHKLARGYAPVATWSVHWIAHPGLREAVGRFLAAERPAVIEEIEILAEHTPFRKDASA